MVSRARIGAVTLFRSSFDKLHLSRLTPLALTTALALGAPLVHAAETAQSAATAAAKAPLPLDELRTFAEVMDRIKAA